jgi:hypothetical protein
MLVITAFTSLLFAIPAAILKCRIASSLFAIVVPVSFAVHAFGGRCWAVRDTKTGRALVLFDKALAQSAAAATIVRVARVAHVGNAVYCGLFFASVGAVFLLYYVFYPKPPRCWVGHHAAFHMISVQGTLWAYMCGA